MLRKSKLRRLYGRRLARQIVEASGRSKAELQAVAEREAALEIQKQTQKGYRLVTRLETGEGVFVKDEHLSALHIQIPSAMYKQLEVECERQDLTKRQVVMLALEQYLAKARG
jgi:hypothetical protein